MRTIDEARYQGRKGRIARREAVDYVEVADQRRPALSAVELGRQGALPSGAATC